MARRLVERFYDRESVGYSRTHHSRFVDDIFETLIFRYVPRKKPLDVVDIGGGIGRFSFPLATDGSHVTILDLSRGMLKAARNLARIGGIKNLSFARDEASSLKTQQGNSYDVVLLMNGVLDYCRDHRGALASVHNLLRKGGTIIGTVNNRFIYATTRLLQQRASVSRFKRVFAQGNYNNQFPVHDFTLDELRKVLKDAGFAHITILGPTSFLRKWEYEDAVTEANRKAFLDAQIDFALKHGEYVNNSSDYFFVGYKV